MLTRRTLLQSSALALGSLALAGPVRIPFRLAYFETYTPFSFRGPQGMRGILVDLLEELLGRRLGLATEHQGYPWLRAQSLVETGQRDAICTVPTQARLAYAEASVEPVLIAPIKLFVRADHTRRAELATVRSVAQLRALDLTVLSYVGNGWAQEQLQGCRVDWGGTFTEALRKLIAGRGDVMVENTVSMQHTLAGLKDGRQISMLEHKLADTRFHLLIGKHSPHLARLADFDSALRQYRQEAAYTQVFNTYGISL